MRPTKCGLEGVSMLAPPCEVTSKAESRRTDGIKGRGDK